jgi:heat shock protein HspQ
VTSDERRAKFGIGDVVKHRFFPFRGIIYDVDPTFGNTEEWWESIPEHIRPAKNQPYYHLLAENEQTTYEAYVSEQNLLRDDTGSPCRHPLVQRLFERLPNGAYVLREPERH